MKKSRSPHLAKPQKKAVKKTNIGSKNARRTFQHHALNDVQENVDCGTYSDTSAIDEEPTKYSGIRTQNINVKCSIFDDDDISDMEDCLEELASDFDDRNTSTNFKTPAVTTKGSTRFKRSKSPPTVLPRRSSLRIRNISVDGIEQTKVEKPKTIYDIQSGGKQKTLIPDGPLIMSDVYKVGGPLSKINNKLKGKENNSLDAMDEEILIRDQCASENAEICDLICKLKKSCTVPEKINNLAASANFDGTLNTFKKFSINSDNVAKVVKERATSLTFHPTLDKVLIAAGDKRGTVGLWDVASTNTENEGIYVYEPHDGGIYGMQFGIHNPHHLYSCSYDGTLRCGDFESGIFDEVFRVDDSVRDVFCKHFVFQTENTILLSLNDGTVQLIDIRIPGKSQRNFQLHSKAIHCVCCHPINPTYVATASADGTAKIWDTRLADQHAGRSHKAVVTSPLTAVHTINHGRSMETAQFSKVMGSNLVTIGYDNTIQVHDCGNLSVGDVKRKAVIRHDNDTGRWLTKFRPTWHPARDDLFVVGSMSRPRRVEVFSDSGTLVHCFTGDVDVVNSVCSLNEFHPSIPCMAGVNSSGRVHIWK